VKTHIAAELEGARARQLALLDPIPPHDQSAQVSALMSPLCWDIAHVAHYEELWLLRELVATPPTNPRFDDVYDAFRHPRATRTQLDLLDPAEARQFAADVRKRVLDVLDTITFETTPLLADGYVYGMVVQHEQQHIETMLATLQLMENPAVPDIASTTPDDDAELPEEVLVEGGRGVMGTGSEVWAYDNERPAHEVDLAPFWIDTTPVTNAAYAEFIAAGGYADPRWWSAAGWDWRQEARLEQPQFWQYDAGRWWRRRFGRVEELPPSEPVQHVCWYEADAYARWRGKRLPTEAEWERAATAGESRRYPWGDAPPSPATAALTFDEERFGPGPVGAHPAGVSASGVHDLLGGVWEWTASGFNGYPGFAPFPYREYSAVFLGEDYKVLRGGSWATHPSAARATFRNWDYPIRRQIFAGFRCARDAAGTGRA